MKNETEKLIYFNKSHAIQYGVNEAILINYFQYWITNHKTNKKNLNDGHTWNYVSRSKLSKLLVFFSEDQVKTILKSLVTQKVLIKGTYNKMLVDKTSWYAFQNEKLFIESTENSHWVKLPNGQVDLPNGQAKLPNGLGENTQCTGQNYPTIPFNKPFKEKVNESFNESLNELPEIEISPNEDDCPWNNQFKNYIDYSGYSTDELNEGDTNTQAKENNSTEGIKTSNKQNNTNTIHMETNNQNKKMNINTKNEMNPGTVHYSKPIEVRPIEILLTLSSTELNGEEKKLRNEYNLNLAKANSQRKQKIVDFYVNELDEKVDRYKFQLMEDIEKIVQSVYIKTNIDGLEEQHKDITSTLNQLILDYSSSYSIEVD